MSNCCVVCDRPTQEGMYYYCSDVCHRKHTGQGTDTIESVMRELQCASYDVAFLSQASTPGVSVINVSGARQYGKSGIATKRTANPLATLIEARDRLVK